MEHQKTIDMIIELGREHRVAIREKVTLVNMLKARAREYVGFNTLKSDKGESLDKRKAEAAYKKLIDDKADPLFLLRVQRIMTPYEECEKEQNRLAREIGKLAKKLPVWEKWAESQHGFGSLMLGKIIAESGRDLSDYISPAKLYKRFGEHVVEGKAPRPQRGQKLGFSPYRRSVSYQLGVGLIKAGGTVEKGNLSFWKSVYEARKLYEIEQAKLRGLVVMPSSRIPEKDSHLFMSEGHIHNRAMKYMRKKFLEALWQEWTGSKRDMNLPDFIQKKVD